jgi:hypothetical protein
MVHYWMLKNVRVDTTEGLKWMVGRSDCTAGPNSIGGVMSTLDILVGMCEFATRYEDAPAFDLALGKLRHHVLSEHVDVVDLVKALNAVYDKLGPDREETPEGVLPLWRIILTALVVKGENLIRGKPHDELFHMSEFRVTAEVYTGREFYRDVYGGPDGN